MQKYIKEVDFTHQMKDLDCPICLNYFDANDKIAKIDCNHLFHKDCLNEWIQFNTVCPMCRKNLCDTELSEYNDGV